MDSRAVLIILLFFFLIVAPNTQQESLAQLKHFSRIIQSEKDALQVLNTSHYGDLNPANNSWLNLTGLRQEDNYIWKVLPRVQQKVKGQLESSIDGPGLKKLFGDKTGEDHALPARNESHGLPSIGDRIPIYHNVTGVLRGKWVRSKEFQDLQSPRLNLSALSPKVSYASQEWNRNITGDGGKIRLKLNEIETTSQILTDGRGSVRQINAVLVIQDETSNGDGWEFTLHGVHFPEFGHIILTTTSEKFSGIFSLPHLALSENAFALSRDLLNRTLQKTIDFQEGFDSRGPSLLYPWSSSPGNPSDILFPVPHCEFIAYIQQHPIGFMGRNRAYLERSPETLDMIENELQNPLGAPIPRPPPISASATLFSPDCGFVLESKGPPEYAPADGNHLVGPKIEAYLMEIRRAVLVFALILAAQLYLLIRQMKDAPTPSTKSRISFYSIAFMAMGDGFVCLAFLVAGIVVDSISMALITASFLAFFCASFLGMKFLMDIWTVQASERNRAAAQNNNRRTPTQNRNAQNTTSAHGVPTNAGTTIGSSVEQGLPVPATTTRSANAGQIPVILPPDQDLDAAEIEDAAAAQATPQNVVGAARRELGALYSRFYFLLLGIVTMSLWALSWPATLRSIYTNVLVFTYLSFWVPQIYRNIMRNCRKALRWEFVIGQSCLRLAPFLYFYTVHGNVLFVEPDANVAIALLCWVWMQICILFSHEILGPRFIIPYGWAPPAYDYHPILREEDEESRGTMPLGFTQATSDPSNPESENKGGTFDCAICMQNIEVPIASRSSGGSAAADIASNLLSRRSYMVTPCRHIFHTPCLEGWMKFRLQCPICRETLPPL